MAPEIASVSSRKNVSRFMMRLSTIIGTFSIIVDNLIMNRLTFFLLLTLAISGANCSLGDHKFFCYFPVITQSSMPTATMPVDLDRYQGVWYDIARKPTTFQEDCDCSMAEYQITEETYFDRPFVRVINTCSKRDGSMEYGKGWAFSRNKMNTRLGVQFSAWMPEGAYYILDIDPDYKWALIGEPCRSYAWVLARDKYHDHTMIQLRLEKLRSLGYDTSDMIYRKDTCKSDIQ